MPKPIIIIKKSVDSQVTQLQAQLTVANNSISSLTSQLAIKVSELSVANADITSLNNQIADINSQLSMANDSITSLNNQLTTANGTIASQSATITGLNNQITGLNNQLTTANNSITSLNNTITAKDNTINSLSGQLTTANNTITTLNGQLTTANNTIANNSAQISRILTVCGNTTYVANTSFTQHTNDVMTQPSRPIAGVWRKDTFNVFIYCTIPSGKNCVTVIDLDWKGGTVTPLWNSSGWNLLAKNVPIRGVANNPITGLNNWSIAGNGVDLSISVVRKSTDSGNYVRVLGINFGVSEL